MNKTICVMCLSACCALGFAQTDSAPVPAKPAPAKAVSAKSKTKKASAPGTPIAVMKIPADAVKTPEGAYRYKDANGKSWIYRETPFGVSRVEDTPRTGSSVNSTKAAAIATVSGPRTQTDSSATVTAVAKGEMITFQKPTPFGVTSWQKRKSDLTPDEQKVWDREQAKGTR
jgi:hypothetical protein